MHYSYALGLIPTIELLRIKPTKAIKVLFKEQSDNYLETEKIKHLCRKNRIKFEYNDRWVNKISHKKNTYAVGIFEKYQAELERNNNHIVLINPSDMGNLGTVIRSMVAFNFKDLALLTPATDIFDPKVVSTTTGALFKINFKHYETFAEYSEEFEFHNLYFFTMDGEKKVKSAKFSKPYSLIFGNESKGIDKDLLILGNTVRIPHSENIESLNLAVSASIGMFEASH